MIDRNFQCIVNSGSSVGELGFQGFSKDAVFEVESVKMAKGVSVYLVVFLLNHLIAKKTKCAFVDFKLRLSMW